MTDVAVDATPRVELHVHLLGAVSAACFAELAARRPCRLHGLDAAAIRERMRFHDLASFIEAYLPLFECVLDAEDIVRATEDAAARIAGYGVVHAEVRFTPFSHVRRGAREEDVLAGLDEGRRRALADHGLSIAWLFDVPRDLGVEAGEVTVRMAEAGRDDGVVGIDFVGSESQMSEETFRAFAPVADAARAAGLHVVAHAGEAAGPWSVAAALDVLGAERIGHGVRAVEDEGVLARLVRDRIPLEVCPTSNLRLGVAPSLAEHPLRELLERGARVTISTDDPVLFDCDLPGELSRVAETLGLGPEGIRALDLASVEAAFVDDATRDELRARIVAG
jgi:aminodeoxyfutalosine deaminase